MPSHHGDVIASFDDLGALLGLDLSGMKGGVFSVKDYGAIGSYDTSGGTGSDDTTAIAAAVTAAAAQVGSAIVYFPPTSGYYRTSASITVPSNVVLMGARTSPHATTGGSRIYCASAVPLVKNADQVNGNDAIGIVGLRLYGNAGGTTHVIDIEGSGANFCHGLLMQGCTVENGSGDSIHLVNVQESWIRDNFALGAGGHAISCTTVIDTVISGNQLTVSAGSAGHGLVLATTSDHNFITDNFCFLATNGINLTSGRRNVIANNRCNTNRKEGIYLVGGSVGNVSYNTIRGNVCYDNGTSQTGTRAGITLDSNSDHNVVTGNVCTRSSSPPGQSQTVGIRLATTVASNLIYGNMCAGNQTTPGLNNTSSGYNTIYGNLVDAVEGVVSYQALVGGLATPTYSASITPDAGSANWQTITVTNATAFTINAPTNPPDATHSQPLTIEISNTSGGAMGVVTWNAIFRLTGGAFTNPATGNKRLIRFDWNGTAWVEIGRSAADYT